MILQDTKSSGKNVTSFNIGIGQITLGIFVILLASVTTWLTVWALGLALLIWGILDLYQGINNRQQGIPWLRLSMGILAFGTGALLVFVPGIGAAALSLVLAVLFIVGGLYNLVAGLSAETSNKGWVVFSGLISIAFGIYILYSWPVERYFTLGILVGVEIILNGWSLAALRLAGKKMKADYNKPYSGEAPRGAT